MHVWLEYEALDGNISKIQEELTHTLRIEIGLYKFVNLVVKISFWDNCTPDFLTQIVVKTRVYVPNDYVVHHREIGNEMMINVGFCKLLKPSKRLNEPKEEIDEAPLTTDELTDDDSKPVRLPHDWDSYDGSADENSDEPCSQLSKKLCRVSGSVFELQGSDVDSDHQRRLSKPNSVPSSIEVEQPRTFRAYFEPGKVFGAMGHLMN